MANLIITVIAIALVAISALMGAYYGGSAFIKNQMSANATTVINQCSQLVGAWSAYLSDNVNTPPTNLTSLTTNAATNNYLQQIPSAPAEPTGVSAFPIFVATASATVGGVAGTYYFAYADMGRPGTGVTAGLSDPNSGACARIQKTATGVVTTSLATAAQGSLFQSGNGIFGCGILSGSISGGLGGATVPAGDLVAGDYVMEYLVH